jgi:hypothetical protein
MHKCISHAKADKQALLITDVPSQDANFEKLIYSEQRLASSGSGSVWGIKVAEPASPILLIATPSTRSFRSGCDVYGYPIRHC